MDTTELLEILNGIFRKVLKRDDITLTESTTAHDVDGWDSLTNMVLITEIENKFGVRFSFREIVKLKNVGGLCSCSLSHYTSLSVIKDGSLFCLRQAEFSSDTSIPHSLSRHWS